MGRHSLYRRHLRIVPGIQGIFQHFNYFDSEEVIDGSGRIPYKISEAASVGPGMIYKFPRMNSLVNLEQRVFLSAILLGGSLTDYYNVIDRNYNMGSGYSIKNNTILDFGRYGMFALNMHLYQIFTWKGYEHKDLETIDPLYLNAQGDKGNVMLAVVNPIIELNLSSHFKANMEVSYYYRHTHYSYHEDIKYKTFGSIRGMGVTPCGSGEIDRSISRYRTSLSRFYRTFFDRVTGEGGHASF